MRLVGRLFLRISVVSIIYLQEFPLLSIGSCGALARELSGDGDGFLVETGCFYGHCKHHGSTWPEEEIFISLRYDARPADQSGLTPSL
jgi:hypothetical protein